MKVMNDKKVTITVRFSQLDYARLRSAAWDSHVYMTDYIRAAIREKMARDKKSRDKKTG